MSQVLDEKLNKLSKEKQELWSLRHTAEHLLHTAMQNLYPKLKKAMGPATNEGFYFDFDLDEKINESDFPKIEKEINRLINLDLPMVQEFISFNEAKEIFKDNFYKLDWVSEIEKRGEKFSVYKMGDIDLDLCSGPHLTSTGKVKTIKLLSVAGAYWHGDEKNKMLQRIYGTTFPTQKELDNYLDMLEEAKKRDHKKIGRELGLFMFHETAPGMAYWLPKGVILYNELINFWRVEHQKEGYQEIFSPLINKKELYETSGHWDHYREDMFLSETDEGEIYALKPMNCPNAMVVFGSETRSYRDLPLRLSDTDTLHRFERSGTLNGLLRIREFRQDDAHIFVTEDQIVDEYKKLFTLTERFYSIFNLEYKFRLGTRPEKFMGDKKLWDKAELELKSVLKSSGKEYSVLEGDGAFYGPKIDILMKDALGREWQMGTLQLDFQQPLRFDLKYSASDGTQKTPVAIHRVIYGSLERFIGVLIEHFGGAFPTWLSPVQTKILPISEKHLDFANEVLKKIKAQNIRAEVDERNETLGAKIRDAQNEKVPYMIILGDKEIEKDEISIRDRDGKNLSMKLSKFIDIIKNEIDNYQ